MGWFPPTLRFRRLFLVPKEEPQPEPVEPIPPKVDKTVISPIEILTSAAKKSLLLSALSPVPILKNPETEITVQSRVAGSSKEERPAPEPPIVQITPSFKPPTIDEQPSSSRGPEVTTLDAAERTRLELVKDYLSRVAIAQAIAKQMLTREIREQAVTAPTMESILEARWSLLSRAQLQQQLLQQSSAIQVSVS